ncbi:MAG: hypothetical protein HOP30_18295 [Cyclobacteriaceae bacterium]|nr:hypothetical protein [Cyclobacteriaceae bacterium]
MTPRVLLVLLLMHASQFLTAQVGNSFLTHYSPRDERIDYRSMGIVQDASGLIYFTNKRGVLEFDGKNWHLITTPGAVYTLCLLQNQLYVGGVFGFGKIVQKGSEKVFQSVFAKPAIFSSLVAADKLYAVSESSLFIISADKIETEIKADSTKLFHGLIEVRDSVFVKAGFQQVMQVRKNRLVKTTLALPMEEEIVFATAQKKTGDVLMGTEAGSVYLMRGKSSPELLSLQDATYLRQNTLEFGVWMNEKQIALGTLLGGVLLIDITTGATIDHLDFSTGLPDNEVFALMADQNGGVWVAHEYGFTRIAPSLPFRSFNHFPGLNGNLLCIQSIQGQVYVGTTLGLYLLAKDESSSSRSSLTVQTNQKRRSRFGFLRKRSGESSASAPPSFETKVVKPVGYAYKKVPGIEGKVIQLIEVNGKLIAAGLGGVFEVQADQVKAIAATPVKTIFFSTSLQQLLVGTYHNQVKTFVANGIKWNETHLLDTLNDHISYAFEDNLQNIWMCGSNKAYRIETLDGAITDATTFSISNSSLDEMVGVAYGNEVYLAASGEFKRFDHKNSFVRYDSLPGPHRYFASAGYFWFNDGVQWRTVDARLRSLKLQWLGLFPNLRFLAPDENAQSLWIITANNELYKFNNSQTSGDDSHFPLLLRQVRGQQINVIKGKRVTMDQPENELAFEFIQPDYISSHAMQYRYQVKGLTNGWTSWSNSNHIANFPYLPPGDYELAMQSRDVLGNESKIEIIPFEILPPYWKRWWFYALEFGFFGILMLLSVKLSVANEKYRTVSEVLSLLTVIIFIQFLQTAITTSIEIRSSPVFEFFIQVFIALIVFPVENYFRKFMKAAAEGKFQLKVKFGKDVNV